MLQESARAWPLQGEQDEGERCKLALASNYYAMTMKLTLSTDRTVPPLCLLLPPLTTGCCGPGDGSGRTVRARRAGGRVVVVAGGSRRGILATSNLASGTKFDHADRTIAADDKVSARKKDDITRR